MRVLKVGDQVRFLNSSGGGIVRRIDGKVVWVEGEDGFDLPTPIRECVPVEEGDTFIPGYKVPQAIAAPRTHHSEENPTTGIELSLAASERASAKREIPMPHLLMPERRDGDTVSLYMAWLLVDPLAVGRTPVEYYLINDSNYTLYYQLLASESNGLYTIVSEGELERDTKLFVEEVSLDKLSSREKLSIAYIPFKRERSFSIKEARTLYVNFDVMRLLKKHAFVSNDFFEEDAIIVPLIEKDLPHGAEKMTTQSIETALENVLTPSKDTLIVEQNRHVRRKSVRKELERPLEVDLHAHQLLPNTEGCTPAEILGVQMTEFRKVMNEAIHNKGLRIVFIHGKGEGVLRKAILDELKKKYPKASAQDASFREYGFGATMVLIH